MSELCPANGLAGLLSAMQPRLVPDIDLAAVRDAAWDAGFVAGAAEADVALAPLRAQLAAAAAAFDAACRIDADTLRPLLMALVRQVAEAVLMAELRADAPLLPLVTAALAAVKPGEATTLRAHPETLAGLAPQLPDIKTTADTALSPSDFAITGADFSIDVDLAQRLADIVAGLA